MLDDVDEAAAQADFTLVEHGALAGCSCPLRLVKTECEVLPGHIFESAGIVWLAITGFNSDLRIKFRRLSGNPAGMDGLELMRKKPRMIMSLTDPKRVGRKIFLGNKPRFACGVMASANADALALAKGVEG